MTTKRYLTCAETAKLVRAALKAKFPTMTFAVRSRTYSGGASIDVTWTDGPTTKQVDAVVGRFEGASFDGMIDLKSYHDSDLNGERVHFGADYIHTTRHNTPEFTAKVGRALAKKTGWAMPEIYPTGGFVHNYIDTGNGHTTTSDLFNRELWQTAA
jgi:hypothetical protein